MKTATKWVLHPILVAAIVFAALPFILPRIGSSASLATEIAIYALYGLGFNLLLGYTGLVSFGASAYFGAAGYAAGIAFLRLFDNMYLAIVFGLALVSSFRDPRPAHAFIDALALRKIGRIVGRRTGAEAGDGEGRNQSEARLYRCPCFVNPTPMGQGSG